MLKRLVVSNLAVVERAEVEFGPGLNVLTGETGAGKSVLMGALELALGGRADSSVVRDGAKEAEVEAEFDGLAIRRTVTAEGRSRAWVNEESVAISELRDLGAGLVDVHGPRANQQILRESFQRDVLDAYGKVPSGGYAAAWKRFSDAKGALEALESDSASEDEMDLLRFQVGELSEAGLSPEDEDLAARHAAAAHAEEIVSLANEATEALGGDDGVAEALIRLQPKFAAIAKHLPEAAEWAAAAENLTLGAQELSRSVADAVSKVDADPAAFAELDARLGVVSRLKRKYLKSGAEGGAVAALTSVLEEKRARLAALEGRDALLAESRAAVERAAKEVRAEGAALSARRAAAAERLARAVTKELRDLGFLQAKFAVRLAPCEPSAHGCDAVEYMFEPNPGEAARPLAAVASSGEIARVMLALKGVLAAHDKTGLLVFDEIDANIGGEVGRAVGEKMKAVAAHHQVVAITHLPQSAVWADRHFVVSKSVSGGRTRTVIAEVTGGARADEIARMLGGDTRSGVVKRHAEELLEEASVKGNRKRRN